MDIHAFSRLQEKRTIKSLTLYTDCVWLISLIFSASVIMAEDFITIEAQKIAVFHSLPIILKILDLSVRPQLVPDKVSMCHFCSIIDRNTSLEVY